MKMRADERSLLGKKALSIALGATAPLDRGRNTETRRRTHPIDKAAVHSTTDGIKGYLSGLQERGRNVGR